MLFPTGWHNRDHSFPSHSLQATEIFEFLSQPMSPTRTLDHIAHLTPPGTIHETTEQFPVS